MTTRRRFLSLMLATVPVLAAAPAWGAAASREPLVRKLRLCGLERHHGQLLWPALQVGDRLRLGRSRDETQPQAIAVYWGEFLIGHAPAAQCQRLQSCMAAGEPLDGRIEELCEQPQRQLVFSVWRENGL
ncbi:MAG TPA: hypothetical protein VLI06_03780 [Solimonas sp.]|nr:hypothetical protein [Solimonas sp.]